MSDFLVSLNKEYDGKALLRLIKKPYGGHSPKGHFFDYSWGSIAVLEERLASNKNIFTNGATTFVWVGELVIDSPDSFPGSFMDHLAYLQNREPDDGVRLQSDDWFRKLNGTFAIVLANTTGLSIVTDPFSFVPVYVGKNERGDVASFGTHPDLVAITSDNAHQVNLVSVAEFLSVSFPTFPYTMYTNVMELNPASLYYVNPGKNGNVRIQYYCYWSPPQELDDGCNVAELAQELRQSLVSAVRDRCSDGKIAVTLSGGLDSRLIMALIPQEVECIGLTFGDKLNREMRIAKKVAKAYNRQWFPLLRDEGFLERSLVRTVKLSGCENEWIHAHAIGLEEKIEQLGVDTIVGGNCVDQFVRGYDAKDMVVQKRFGGLLPKTYAKVEFDYENDWYKKQGQIDFSRFWRNNFVEEIREQMCARRKRFHDYNFDPNRTSMAELLLNYPSSQNFAAPSITAERRVLPLRTCGADRRILDFACKCPVTLKLGNRILFMACREIYGKGRRIPNASDGVRPCSTHWARLAQRAIRKFHRKGTDVLEKLGGKPRVQHSWQDYQTYWDESVRFKEMIKDYGLYLDQFDGRVFTGHGRDLLKRKDMHWNDSFRLLQLAVWRKVTDDFRKLSPPD